MVRVSGGADERAWEEFVELYGPAIYRAIRYYGLQDADAQDTTQQVLMSVARALEQRPHDPSRARFRTWLSRVIRNAALNVIRQSKPDRGTGDSEWVRRLSRVEDEQDGADVLEQEYQKELFRKAARDIEPEFAEDTWQAFWLTAVEGREITEVARQLSKKVGSIYAARSRVIRRLRQQVQLLAAQDA